jgi:hypothetical protein
MTKITATYEQPHFAKFNFDWTGVDEMYQWVALDKDSSCHVYTGKPQYMPRHEEWMYPDDCATGFDYKPILHQNFDVGGPEYLMQRPAREALPVITKPVCPHAELMLEYAKDAMKYEKPWEMWEYKLPSSTWETFISAHPAWSKRAEYRRKPQTVAIEIPLQHKEAIEAFIESLEG